MLRPPFARTHRCLSSAAHRPRVRVVMDRAGQLLEKPYDVNLWESDDSGQWASTVVAPLDPADYHIDPLAVM